LRCEQLGHQFDRHQLDELYRHFVVLADQIKHVEEVHLLELISAIHTAATDDRAQVKSIPLDVPAFAAARPDSGNGHSKLLRSMSVSGGAGNVSFPLSPMAEHHGDQEDYLWGV
jgi:hypothetical protein